MQAQMPRIVEDQQRGSFLVPRKAFTSREVFEREYAAIFDSCWLYLGHASELAGPGAFLTRTVARRPILFTRNRDDMESMIKNARQITIYTKSLTHVLATRPWKIVWGFGGPLPIEPEEEKYQPPEKNPTSQKSEDYKAPEK